MLANEYKLPVMRQILSGGLTYSMVTTVNDTVIIHLKVAKTIDVSLQKKKW